MILRLGAVFILAAFFNLEARAQIFEAECIKENGAVVIRARTTAGRTAFLTRYCKPLTCDFGTSLTADASGWTTFPATSAGNALKAETARVGDGSAYSPWVACGPRKPPAVIVRPPQEMASFCSVRDDGRMELWAGNFNSDPGTYTVSCDNGIQHTLAGTPPTVAEDPNGAGWLLMAVLEPNSSPNSGFPKNCSTSFVGDGITGQSSAAVCDPPKPPPPPQLEPKVVRFHALPQALKHLSDRPRELLVPLTSPLVVSWSVKDGDRVELTETKNGKAEALVNLSSVGTKSGRFLNGSTILPAFDAVYRLRVFSNGTRIDHPLQIRVTTYVASSLHERHVVRSFNSFEWVPVKVDAAPAAGSIANFVGPLSVPPTGLACLTPKKNGELDSKEGSRDCLFIPADNSALSFDLDRGPGNQTMVLADYEPEAMREKIVSTVRRMHGLGIDKKFPRRRLAYLDAVGPAEHAELRRGFEVDDTPDNGSCEPSSCAIFIRSLWRMLGARDFLFSEIPTTIALDRRQKACGTTGSNQDRVCYRINRSYRGGDTLFGDLKQYAAMSQALHEPPFPISAAFAEEFQDRTRGPRKGDVIAIVRGGSQHIFTIVERLEGTETCTPKPGNKNVERCSRTITFRSVDGGQVPPASPGAGEKRADGKCTSIRQREHRVVINFDKKADGTLDFSGNKLEFSESTRRPVIYWIDSTKLRFPEPIRVPVIDNSDNSIPRWDIWD